MRKNSRTISGVTPLAVMAEPRSCPGKCVYCPSHEGAPQSYTRESPVVLRARKSAFSAVDQVRDRLKMFAVMGHSTQKVELIIMGGTFLAYPEEYQYRFVKDCYDALNGFEAPSLADAQRENEQAVHRCVGVCIETRPDWCGEAEIRRLLEFGVTRVELGVQTLDDSIYRIIRRGHTVEDVVVSTRRLKDHGFKVYYHWMPGLPGSTPEWDLELSSKLFQSDSFKPDGMKLYPTLVVQGSELEIWHRDGRYRPYPDGEMVELLAKIKSLVPGYTRISRVMRDIPTSYIVAGLKDLGLREVVKRRMKSLGLVCDCTRCREYGHRRRDGWNMSEPFLRRFDYMASGGQEVFLTFEDEGGTLFALLRLRRSVECDWALIREIHVFGQEVPIGVEAEYGIQHKGLGEALVQQAETIARDEFQTSQIRVLAGVGARDYFAKFGYTKAGAYLVKEFKILQEGKCVHPMR